MKNIGRGIFALVALFFLGTGLMLMFNPARVLEHMLVAPPESAAALSSIRGLWGGGVTAIGLSVLIGAIKADFAHIRVGAIFVLAIVLGRVAGYVTDGGFPELGAMITPPIVVFVLMIVAHKLVARGEP